MAGTPRVRFKEFTDVWEQRKVGELIEDYTERTVMQNQYPVLTSSQQQGIVFQEDYFADRQVTTNDTLFCQEDTLHIEVEAIRMFSYSIEMM